ncbi:MAG TPA: hypothetical protein VF507_10730 [Pyrinomonadaceae bacterium]|jgi:hypothetical protein
MATADERGTTSEGAGKEGTHSPSAGKGPASNAENEERRENGDKDSASRDVPRTPKGDVGSGTPLH